jgi:hypothetical protein
LNKKAKPRTKIRADDLHMVYNVKVIVFKLRFERPMSPPVATAVGTTFELTQSVWLSAALAGVQVILLAWPLWRYKVVRPNSSDDGRHGKLDEHVTKGDKEGERETVVFWREHPLVVHRQQSGERVPAKSVQELVKQLAMKGQRCL